MPLSSASRGFIAPLSGLRFLAALLVLLGHLSGWLSPFKNDYGVITYYMQNLVIVGMPLFFVLSGFIMQHVYGDAFKRRIAISSLKEFAVARFSRLYPLYVFFIVVLISYTHPNMFEKTFTNGDYLQCLIRVLTMTQTWTYDYFDDQPSYSIYWMLNWSISTEVFFYLVFPPVSLAIARLKTARAGAVALASATAFFYLYQFLIYINQDGLHAWSQPLYVTDERLFPRWLAYFSPYGRLPEFITGCITARLVQLLSHTPVGAREKKLGGIFAVGFGAIIFVLWLTFGTVVYTHSEQQFGFLVYLHQNYLMAPAIAGLIFCLGRYQSAAAKLLAWPPIVYLGEISYSIYMSHPMIPDILHSSRVYPDVSILSLSHYTLILCTGILTTIIISIGTYTLIELPFKGAIRNLFNNPVSSRFKYHQFVTRENEYAATPSRATDESGRMRGRMSRGIHMVGKKIWIALLGGALIAGAAFYLGQKIGTKEASPNLASPPPLAQEEKKIESIVWLSDEFVGGQWQSAENLTIASGAATAPDGTKTASRFQLTNADGFHRIERYAQAIEAGGTYTFSVYLKPKELTAASLEIRDSSNAKYGVATFEIVSSLISRQTGDIIGAKLEQAPDGWVRVMVAMPFTTDLAVVNITLLNEKRQTVYSGDGSSSLFVWGAQFDRGSAPSERLKKN